MKKSKKPRLFKKGAKIKAKIVSVNLNKLPFGQRIALLEAFFKE